MLMLVLELAGRRFGLRLTEVDRILPVSNTLIAESRRNEMPKNLVIGGQARSLVAMRECILESNSNIVRGSRLLLPRGNSQFVYLAELVLGLIEIKDNQESIVIVEDKDYQMLTLQTLCQTNGASHHV